MIQVFYFSGIMLNGPDRDYWACNSSRYVLTPYENYKCPDGLNSVFYPKMIRLPLVGYEIECLPAQMYCVLFGFFASLIGPFAGFMCSGFKRAYGLKDFAQTLPGHGGFVDRFDCCLISIAFIAVLLREFVFREQIFMDTLYE